jgi:hypothetical protein
LILEHNIVGTDIDARALILAKFALTVQLMMLRKDTAAQSPEQHQLIDQLAVCTTPAM